MAAVVAVCPLTASTAAQPFILQLLLGLLLTCPCQPWVVQAVLLFPGFNPARELVKPRCLPTVFVLQSHIPRASTCKWRKVPFAENSGVSTPSPWPFPSGHFSLLHKFSLSHQDRAREPGVSPLSPSLPPGEKQRGTGGADPYPTSPGWLAVTWIFIYL